jgi:hypothetical protein
MKKEVITLFATILITSLTVYILGGREIIAITPLILSFLFGLLATGLIVVLAFLLSRFILGKQWKTLENKTGTDYVLIIICSTIIVVCIGLLCQHFYSGHRAIF